MLRHHTDEVSSRFDNIIVENERQEDLETLMEKYFDD
tara:strand:+ start:951 stop:1061 length:111 start_codon:yes stop_codon:yes gene_type:complete